MPEPLMWRSTGFTLSSLRMSQGSAQPSYVGFQLDSDRERSLSQARAGTSASWQTSLFTSVVSYTTCDTADSALNHLSIHQGAASGQTGRSMPQKKSSWKLAELKISHNSGDLKASPRQLIPPMHPINTPYMVNYLSCFDLPAFPASSTRHGAASTPFYAVRLNRCCFCVIDA